LVGHYLQNPRILAHKSIELSDLQGYFHVGGDRHKIFGFAKQSSSKTSGLTARNKNGAILLGQILLQLDQSVFDTAVIVTSSTVNEDLAARLETVCAVFGKQLLILDKPILQKMYIEFEEQLSFEDINAKEMVNNS
jgi:hypothetical protein